MDKTIKTAMHMHQVRDAIAYELAHVAAIAKLQRYGHEVELHESGRVKARIEAGFWISDCGDGECRAGNAAHPEWPEARCFACGAIHEVKFPKARKDIEAVLLARPQAVRNWVPGETVASLRAENKRNGVS